MAITRAAAAPSHTPIQRRAASAITVVAILASGLGVAAGLQLASAASGSVSGTVFLDYDADGTIDGREPGVGAVEVVAVDADGNRTAPVYTQSDGTYSIDLAAAETSLGNGPYRVEFAGWPSHLHETPMGPDNGSSIQFVDADTAGVSLGLAEPGQYCQAAPDIAAPCFVYAGLGNAAAEAAVVSVGWDWSDNNSRTNPNGPIDWQRDGNGQPVVETTLATIGQVGAVWGEAWDRDRGVVYVGAFVKRHTELGPTGNPTTIYAIDTKGTPDTADDVVGPWFTVDATAVDPHTGASDGWHKDFGAFDDVLVEGLGDIELSPDGSTMYAVDLGNRALVAIPIDEDGAPGTPVRMPIPANMGITDGYVGEGSCAHSDLRPAGLGVAADGRVHVGVVCSAESTVSDDDYGIDPRQGRIDGWNDSNTHLAAGDPRLLHGYVSVWDGDVDAPRFNTILEFPLDGPRQCIAFNNSCPIGGDSEWRPWVDAYPYDRFDDTYSQPAITDIDFDNDAMIVALVDRWGHQVGPETRVIRPSDGREIGYRHPVAGGDVLRACDAGDGTFDIEGTAGCPINTSIHGEREFFVDDRYGGAHRETGQGSVAIAPGFQHFIHAQMDPVNAGSTWRSGGFAWTDAEAGTKLKGLRIYDGRNHQPSGTFEKASGIGDVELLCDAAPLTIGNRVWLDLDGDGTQDADEPGINGVVVELLDRDGALVSSVTSGGADPAAGSWSFTIEPDTAYTVRFDVTSANGLPFNITPADLEVSPQGAGDGRIDSDIDTSAEIAIAPMGAGENDHSLDAGFSAIPEAPVLDVEKTVASADGLGAHIDADSSGDGAGVAWYHSGTVIDFTVVVVNEGPGALTDVVVDDPVSPSCAAGPFDLAAGERREWTCTHAHGVDAASVVNTATASGGWQPPYGPGFDQVTPIVDVDDAVVRIVTPAIGIDKSTVTGVPYGEGAEVTYTYAVTNDGDVDLVLGSPVRLSDDTCDTIVDAGFHPTAGAPFNVGDTDADGILDVEADGADFDDALGTETWQFLCITNVDLADLDLDDKGDPGDTITNTVTILGTPVEPDGSPTGLSDVSRQDTATIDVAEPAVQIETQVWHSGNDTWRNADALDGETGATRRPGSYYEGELAEYRYIVTNTGNTHLADGVITDSGDHLGGCALPLALPATLAPGASVTVGGDGSCRSADLGSAGPLLENIGTIIATPVDEAGDPIAGTNAVSDSDPAATRVVIARVNIEKVPGVQTLVAGGEATWTFHVTNTSRGVSRLENVIVSDVQSNGQVCSPQYVEGDDNDDGRLHRRETWVYTCTIADVVASGTDVATVTADLLSSQPKPGGAASHTVSDTAEARHAIGIVELDKQVRVADGEWTDWVTVRTNETVDFRVVVTNPGDVPVIDAVLTDDQCALTLVAVDGDGSASELEGDRLLVLSPGESWTYECSHTSASEGDVVNTATLNGTLVENPLTDDGEDTPEPDMTGTEAMPESISSAGYTAVEPRLSTEISIVRGTAYDADDEAGTRGTNDGVLPVLPVGEQVTFHYSVRNDGVTNLFDVTVALDAAVDCTLFTGDPLVMAPAEEAHWFCDYVAGETGATYRVDARADRAEALDGHPLGAVVVDGDDTDSVAYLVADVTLEKYAVDADGIAHEADTALDAVGVLDGLDATWRFGVTNTGDVALSDVGVDDFIDLDGDGTYDCVAPIARVAGDGTELAVGETWTYECTTGPVVADIENNAEVWAQAVSPFGDDPSGVWVTATDPAFVSMVERASIGDRVWLDIDGNGVQDNDEVGVAGVVVDLRDTDGVVVESTTTNEDGLYLFDRIVPGTYQLRVTPPIGHTIVTANQGVDDTVDSDFSDSGFVPLTTLDPGENDLSWDAGLYVPAGLGDLVWLDGDADGMQGEGELGIAGIEVELLDGDTGASLATTTTGADGAYRFEGLAPDAYRVRVHVPDTHRVTDPDQGDDDAGDSDVADDEDLGVVSPTVTLISGSVEDSIDAGLYVPAAVGSHAWVDANADGFQDEDEAGLGGVLVRLIGADGEIVATTTTDHAGAYLFTDLTPGAYRIEFVVPAGMEVAPLDAVETEVADSDLDPATGRTAPVTLTSGQTDTTWDAGFIVPTVVLSSPEENATETPALAITGRTTYLLVGLGVFLVGAGGSSRILSDRIRRREDVVF
ncbi:MAG: SdrD B-like domain-containing protein [Actinomycetota bacterium]